MTAFSWPDDKRAALCITFDMDAEAAVLAVDEKYSLRPSIMSHQQYGPVTGVPRLLDVLRDVGVRASFFIPGFSAERHPGAVAAIVECGHEVCHHGYLHRPPGLIDGRRSARSSNAAWRRSSGPRTRATIFRAPWWETSKLTFDLLIEYGFTCDSSLFDRDVPYRLGVGSSELIEVPVSWALDDWEKYAFLPDPPTGSGLIEPASRVLEIWWEEIAAYLEVGGCCVLTMHPFLSGRPSRASRAAVADRARGRGVRLVDSDDWRGGCALRDRRIASPPVVAPEHRGRTGRAGPRILAGRPVDTNREEQLVPEGEGGNPVYGLERRGVDYVPEHELTMHAEESGRVLDRHESVSLQHRAGRAGVHARSPGLAHPPDARARCAAQLLAVGLTSIPPARAVYTRRWR